MSYVTPYDPNDPQLVTINPGASVKAGDTLMLYSGFHGKVILTNYINTNYITIINAPNNTPIIEKIHIQAGNKWRFKGLTISTEPFNYYLNDNLVFLESHNWQGPVANITIDSCYIYSTLSPWTDSLSWVNNASNGIQVKADSVKATSIN